MKTQRLIICMCLFFAFAKAYSQHQKGDRLVAATVAPYPTSQNDRNDIGIIVKADAEFFITNNISFITSGFYSSNTAFQNKSGLPLEAFGIVPSVQYYVLNKEKWSLYGLVGYGFGFTTRNISGSVNSAISVVSLGAGVQYKVGDKLFLKLQVPYFKAQNISFGFTEVEGAAPFIGASYAF